MAFNLSQEGNRRKKKKKREVPLCKENKDLYRVSFVVERKISFATKEEGEGRNERKLFLFLSLVALALRTCTCAALGELILYME